MFACSAGTCRQTRADLVNVVNSGFEDTTGQTVFNEFTFGEPVGWTNYNPDGILPSSGIFPGTLRPNGVDFFDDLAPEGERVAILFNSTRQGEGVYGMEQTLSTVLKSDTRYTLTVEVGNIASGFASNGTFFNLDEFPGYQVDLLAGGVVLAQDLNSLTIPEAEFATSTVSFQTSASHAQLGQPLGIRIVNLNEIPAGFDQATSPDLEVDFDRVRLDVSAVPEPGAIGWLGFAFAGLVIRRKRSQVSKRIEKPTIVSKAARIGRTKQVISPSQQCNRPPSVFWIFFRKRKRTTTPGKEC